MSLYVGRLAGQQWYEESANGCEHVLSALNRCVLIASFSTKPVELKEGITNGLSRYVE